MRRCAIALVVCALVGVSVTAHAQAPANPLWHETIQLVFFQAAQSLIAHGFKRVLLLNSHGGNQAISRYVVDRINQETSGVAVELSEAAQPFLKGPRRNEPAAFDRHAGVNETSASLYLTPNLVNMREARTAPLTLPPHLQKMAMEAAAVRGWEVTPTTQRLSGKTLRWNEPLDVTP